MKDLVRRVGKGRAVIEIYSVALLEGKEVTHCDLVYDNGTIRLERLASRGLGRSRRGLSRSLDLFLYKIEKERTKREGLKKTILEVSVEDLKCWRVEEHTGKGVGKEYENSVLFILKLKDGRTLRMLISKKAYNVLEQLVKKLKRAEVERCKRV